ncbi:asparagine synthase (glutamine-hydrolyzing) [Candidatus Woesearchaeota archaeon]|nr:asparagine synthase (glutamine-hydrolyzing) [Candidatus Woesearchaeota archaeon]
MCGIAGFNWDDQELIKSMSSILVHRGPDGEGIYTNSGISLGHRRLSILDLSSAGAQPMSNKEGDLTITYNGEIYNFHEIREKLKEKGYRFKSNTDTEVLLYGYQQWGEKVLERLNGMFAFAIWDDRKKKLFLARDRVGIKPLYYFWDGERFIFGSEIKALLLHNITRSVNKNAAKDYLNLRYMPGEDTLFQGIKKLLPGHYMILKDKELQIEEFWNYPLPEMRKDKNAAKEVKKLLSMSIRKRLIADVPIGVYLSGGLDSAAITGLVAGIKKDPVKTFSVGFDYNDKVDELVKAKEIAEHFHTDHQEIIVDGPISGMLPRMLWHLDMPHGDPVIIPQFKLSELASKKVKVVLSGEGADETFGGYVQYKKMLQLQKLQKIPTALMNFGVKHIPIKVFDQLFDYPSSIGEKGKEKVKDLAACKHDMEKAYGNFVSILSDADRKEMLNFEGEQSAVVFQKGRSPLLNQMLYYDSKTWMPNYVLHINDRMTMANSIEGRVPFLDHTLVEYGNNLHPSLKIKNGVNKWVVREAMKKVLPKSNTKKHAFFMPLDKWYKEELKDLMEQMFTPQSVRERGDFSYDVIKKIWENYEKSKLLYGKQMFTLLNFELWHRMFIDGEHIPTHNNIHLHKYL